MLSISSSTCFHDIYPAYGPVRKQGTTSNLMVHQICPTRIANIHFDTVEVNHQFSDTPTSSYGWSYLTISHRILLYPIFHYYCRASHTGDAPRVVVVAQNVDCLLCCHLVTICLHSFFLRILVVANRQIGCVSTFFGHHRRKKHHKYTDVFVPRKPKTTVFTMFSALGEQKSWYFTVFCGLRLAKTLVFTHYSVLDLGAHKKQEKSTKSVQNAPSSGKPRFYPLGGFLTPKNVKIPPPE